MNPILQGQLRQLRQGLLDIEQALETAELKISDHEQREQQLLSKFWNQSHELRVIQNSITDYETLANYTRDLESVLTDLQQRLHAILDAVKALSQEYLK